MNLANYTNAMSKFKSTLESPALSLNIISKDITSGASLKMNNVKALLSYYIHLYIKEIIADTQINLIDLDDNSSYDEVIGFTEFIYSTHKEDKPSFYFETTDVVEKVPLRFRDLSLIGEVNIFKPFDTVDEKDFSTQMTSTLEDIKLFSQKYYKHKSFRGIIAFQRPTLHTKGYTIYLVDKKLFATIISVNYNLVTGYGTYLAILYTGK